MTKSEGTERTSLLILQECCEEEADAAKVKT
jgi:hypothetical protein